MKSRKLAARGLSIVLAAALGCGGLAALSGCSKSGDKPLVIMTQELNGLFNPFYSTTGTDMDVVGQTQISMFSTDNDGNIACGDNEAVVVKDYMYQHVADGTTDGKTVYTFVIKPDIVFSDGEPLTMNDVMFNLYVYLDPAYTGSTTMYSTDIVGLQDYRTQKSSANSGSAEDDKLTAAANAKVNSRILELTGLFQTVGKQEGLTTYFATEKMMEDYIQSTTYVPSPGYMSAIWPNGEPSEEELKAGTKEELARKQVLEDYRHALELFKEELGNDYNAAKDAYQEAPYTNKEGEDITNHTDVKFDEIVSFMYYEGYFEVEYGKMTGSDGKERDDRNNIQKLTPTYPASIKTRDAAIEYVYSDNVENNFSAIVTAWGTASTIQSEYLKGDGGLVYKNISGIRSLGHMPTGESAPDTVTIEHRNAVTGEVTGSVTYNVAKNHDENNVPVGEDVYDVLQITINGSDPKAIWNFGFTVAPYHYYSDPDDAKYAMDIANNKFGVEWASFDFHSKVIQGLNKNGVSKNKVPVGAGPYIASDRNNGDKPTATTFVENNIVYYKSNPNFLLGEPKIKALRYQVIPQSNAIGQLEDGVVHYVEPQFTLYNQQRLDALEKKGFMSLNSWQLGYGYIGINAKYVPNIYIRRAIMAAMNTSLSIGYYQVGAADTINWPMSMVNWAYPRDYQEGYPNDDPILAYKKLNNGHAYTTFNSIEAAKTKVRDLMKQAGVPENDASLHIKFTIAGSDLIDHPCYRVFLQAKEILDDCGWNIELTPDTYALNKLSTGSLAVWAAAWGSTIDPDMYQVYHKNSTASSVKAWGYPSMLATQDTNPNPADNQTTILNELSALIEQGRETLDQNVRIGIYEQAMSKVLDLAVELPVYQRKTLYAFNANVIDVNTLPHDENGNLLINPYTSPLSRIWEVDFVK